MRMKLLKNTNMYVYILYVLLNIIGSLYVNDYVKKNHPS